MSAPRPESLVDRVQALPRADRRILVAMVGLGLLALVAGLLAGTLFGLVRVGWIEQPLGTGYVWLSLHGPSVFFFWLYLGQGALLLALAATGEAAPGIARRGLAWAGLGAMGLGLALAWAAPLVGPPLLYDAPPEVAGDARLGPALAYAGYLALAAGLALTGAATFATLLRSKRAADDAVWTSLQFGIAAWAGLLVVTALAAAATFLPALAWALGLAPLPEHHGTRWHLLFHNLHYLPLLGTVLTWYALVPELTGVRSMFGDRFSKLVFAIYLLLVPPTSLYHMFLEPDLAAGVRVLGSLLSLFIGVPTIGVFLILTVSLEADRRARGARGPLGWLRDLPWREPGFATIAAAVLNLALGGTFAFVLIQERLASLLSDTFFVPAYFHFLTVGTVSLTALAGLGRLIPGLVGHDLPAPRLRVVLAWLVTAGLVLFGTAGILAGLSGMPRRVAEVGYDGVAPALWLELSTLIGVGALLMTVGILGYVAPVATALFGAGRARRPPAAVPAAPSPALASGSAWTGPATVALLVLATYGATWAAVRVMLALPVIASGTLGH